MKNSGQISLRKEHGFTIVELMIASTLGLIVLAVVGSLFMHTRKLNDLAQARIAVQQDLRTAASLITRDARMAGNFGCLSLGRLYSVDMMRMNGSVSGQFGVTYGAKGDDKSGKDSPTGIARLTDNPADAGGSFGMRWIKLDDMKTNQDIPAIKSGRFTPASGALLFYYGAGTTGLKKASTGNIQFEDTSPNQVVANTVANGGYVILSSCLAANIQSSKTVNKNMSFDIPNLLQDPSSLVNPPKVNQHIVREVSLMRYMVTAYMVGDVDGEPSALYRFELQEDGSWGPPELLARHVTAMNADYVFIPDCPSAAAESAVVNNYTFTVQSADEGNTIRNAATGNDPRPPVAVNLVLTYDYPQAFGQDTAAQMTDNIFRIDATVRGGNVCAERKL